MKLKFLTILVLLVIMSSCGGDKAKQEVAKEPENKEVAKTKELEKIDPMKDKGVGPIKSITLGEIDNALAEKGKGIFKTKCTACHKINKRFVGPALKGVTKKTNP